MARKKSSKRQPFDDLDAEFEYAIKEAQMEFFNSIVEEVERLFKLAIIRAVYAEYPSTVMHHRQWQLVNNAVARIENEGIHIYFDFANMHYESVAKEHTDMTEAVPWLVQVGHVYKKRPNPYMFNTYPARDYMKTFVDLMKKELKLEENELNIELKEPDY